MRISHVIHTYPPYSRAGSENYLEALAAAQARRHEVSVFHRIAEPGRPEYETTEARVGGISVVRLNRIFSDFSAFSDTYRSSGVAEAFSQYLDRYRPDVVHVHHLTCLSSTCVDEAKTRGIPIVFTLHDFWLMCPRGQLLRRDRTLCSRHSHSDCVRCLAAQLPIDGGHPRVLALWQRADRLRSLPLPGELYRFLASRPFARETAALAEIAERERHILEMSARVDRFVSPSSFLRDIFVDFGIPAEKIIVSDNGFDLESWCHPPKRLPRRTDEPLRAAYLGTWIPSKGVDLAIRAFQGVDPRCATLDVYGYSVPYDDDDTYEDLLGDLASSAPSVRIHGRYTPSQIPGLLASADVLVVPSIWYENSPLTIHEAWLARVPVIAAGHGGMREHVRAGVDGLHFRPGSVASLRRTVRRLAGDRSLLERLRSGIGPVKSIEANAVELDRLYVELGAPAGALPHCPSRPSR